MKISEIINYLYSEAPPQYQESYDNAKLIVGDPGSECSGALVCLDSTEAIVEEAIAKNCNLIIAHHPIIFKGLTSLTGKNYIERTIIKAIRNNIAILACHTNLDNMPHGVNRKFAYKIGLKNCTILAPKKGLLSKLTVFCPVDHVDEVRSAIFSAGAGVIGDYDCCSYNLEGYGTFRGNENSDPFVGKQGEIHLEKEMRIETILPKHITGKVVTAMIKAHPYEEVAYDIYPLENDHPNIGAGIIGELEQPLEPNDFLDHLKSSMELASIKYTQPTSDTIQRVAICGGSGSFLLKNAISKKADAFVTGDFKYHQFFDADGQIMICDIGHYESERFTIELIGTWLMEKFPNFAVHLTETNTNPINYY